MKQFLLIAALTAVTLAAHATLYSTNWSGGFVNGTTIPDNNYSGWTDSRLTAAAPAGTVQSVAVTLNLSGGWNGDLYAYLVNSSAGFCVLLNQVGPGAYGYGDAGMNVILADAGAATTLGIAPSRNINVYQDYLGAGNPGPGVPTGVWNPDNTSGTLGSFTAQGGTWTLFIADLNGGGVTTVQDWGLQMDIVAVPEVETWIAAALAGAFGAFWLNRQIMSGIKKT